MPAGGEYLAVKMHIDVVPGRKVPGEPFVESRVGMLDASKRLVRKDDPESKGVIRGISLPNLDLVLRVEELDKRRKVEPGRPAADDREVEGRPRGAQLLSRSLNRCSLPVAVRGSVSENSIARGYL